MYLITVKVSDYQTLHFTVAAYEREGSHIVFTDAKTGMRKSFPDHLCLIEETNKETAP